jgi:hypothetical protein
MRRPSLVLFRIFGIHMQDVTDIHLLGLASRPASDHVMLLSIKSALRSYAGMAAVEHMHWGQVRYDARMRCGNSEHGRASGVLLPRPLHPDIVEFCVQYLLICRI